MRLSQQSYRRHKSTGMLALSPCKYLPKVVAAWVSLSSLYLKKDDVTTTYRNVRNYLNQQREHPRQLWSQSYTCRLNKHGLTPLSPAVYEWFGDVVPGGKVFASHATQFMATVAVLFSVWEASEFTTRAIRWNENMWPQMVRRAWQMNDGARHAAEWTRNNPGCC